MGNLEMNINTHPESPKIIRLLLCLILGLLCPTALAQKTLYGFTAFPYDLTFEAVDTVDKLAVANSSLYAVHRDDGCIPWREALSGEAFPAWLTNDWANIKARVPSDMPISLHITPTQSDRTSLSYQCGKAEGEAGEMPEMLENKPFNSSQLVTAYLNYARRIADVFEPEFLTIGIEMSELSLKRPEAWESFAELMMVMLEGLRESHPELQLSVEFVLQSLLLPRVAEQVKPLTEKLDFLGISFYPYGSGFGEALGAPALSEPPAQWLEPLKWLRAYTDKPVAIVETGYATKAGRAYGIRFSGDEGLQEAFLKDLVQLSREDDYLFVVWFVPVDYNKLLAKLPEGDNAEAANIWVNTGLFDSDLKPKPAWKIWQSLFEAR
jgi:hypothetical protein